jgi:fructose-bisphosphate aldolase class II
MHSYKEIGLVNTKVLFQQAMAGHYAIPAYNFNNMEQMQAIIQACVETKSPVILQVSKGARQYADKYILRHMAAGAVEYAHELGCDIPIVLHLDHGPSFEVAKDCIENGFSSVMIDGSALPYEENVKLTKQVCDFAHKQKDYVTVEGELGVLAGVEDEVSSSSSHYTKPEEVQDFVQKTGVDSLAISIGTSHGRCKFTPAQCTRTADGILIPPPLAFDVLEGVEEKLPGFPIVLHGSSSVPIQYVKEIKQYGGNLPDSVGIPEEQLRKAAKSAVCKINIDSDGRLAMTAAVRKVLAEKPDVFDPRLYLGPARDELKVMYEHKNKDVLGSAGHAEECMKAIIADDKKNARKAAAKKTAAKKPAAKKAAAKKPAAKKPAAKKTAAKKASKK